MCNPRSKSLARLRIVSEGLHFVCCRSVVIMAIKTTMIPSVVQQLAHPGGPSHVKLQVRDAIVVDGKQGSDPVAPV